MAEIREIFETVRTYCGMMFGDAKLDAKSVTGKMYCHALLSEGEKVAVRAERVTDTREGLSQISSLQNPPLSRISNAHNSSQRTATSSIGEVNVTAHDNNSTKLQGKKNSLIETNLFTYSPIHLFTLKRAAFTLAEVLITLGIIGVVAALTLPTLIQNHQKQVYVTQLKKAYSNISNAYNQIANEEGVTEWSQTCLTDWTENNNCLHKLAKQMKAINTKDFDVTCSADWCKYGYDLDDGIDISTSWSIFNPATGMFTTPDGVLYMFACGSFSTILVDVNGINKSPNKPGRDIFEFGRKVTSDYDANGHWIGYTDYNSLEPSGAYSWDPDAWKNCSATNLSTSCTAKVLIEGKMNY